MAEIGSHLPNTIFGIQVHTSPLIGMSVFLENSVMKIFYNDGEQGADALTIIQSLTSNLRLSMEEFVIESLRIPVYGRTMPYSVATH